MAKLQRMAAKIALMLAAQGCAGMKMLMRHRVWNHYVNYKAR